MLPVRLDLPALRRARHSRFFIIATTLLLSLSVVSDTHADFDPPLAAYAEPAPTMIIVAHHDDDIGMGTVLFPTVRKVAEDPELRLQTVVLTDGNAGFGGQDGCQTYVDDRETGHQAAYAKMAGLPETTTWMKEDIAVLGKKLRKATLPGTGISIIYMGVENPALDIVLNSEHIHYSQMFTNLPILLEAVSNSEHPIQPTPLENLWNGAANTVATQVPFWDDDTGQAQTYTREELIQVLTALMEDFQPIHISTQSGRTVPWYEPQLDHPDHIHTGTFALAAAQRYTGAASVRLYHGYDNYYLGNNASTDEKTNTGNIFETYAQHDIKVCGPDKPFGGWIPGAERYKICLPNTEEQNLDARCDSPVAYKEGAGSGHTQIVFNSGSGQILNGRIKAPTNTCVGSFGNVVVTASNCYSTLINPLWEITGDGAIKLQNTNQCMTADSLNHGSSITLQTCNGSLTQNFVLTSTHQLRGPDASCVTKAETSSMLTIQECELDVHVPNQRQFVLVPQEPPFTAATTGFTVADMPDNNTYYGSIGFGKINSDDTDDVCMRRADGIHCAFWDENTNSFINDTLMTVEFRDGVGSFWNVGESGATVQLADINNDGRADVCGAGYAGVYCAQYDDGTGTFINFSVRASTSSFAGIYDDASHQLSLRLVDVDNDGYADVCGRADTGIECALNDQTGNFQAAQYWITGEFDDANGWGDVSTGATIVYGDINGDGWNDVCGRGANGVICAVNKGEDQSNVAYNAFHLPHRWSFAEDGDFSAGWAGDESRYGSITLVDVNGDGKADICGRSDGGVVCGLSQGSTFTQVIPMLGGNDYSDAAGFQPAAYGSTLAFPNLNNDSQADICVRGPLSGGGVGLLCTFGSSN